MPSFTSLLWYIPCYSVLVLQSSCRCEFAHRKISDLDSSLLLATFMCYCMMHYHKNIYCNISVTSQEMSKSFGRNVWQNKQVRK